MSQTKASTVKEVFQGKVVWEGDVEVFQIRGHPKANRAFAWSHVAGTNDQQTRYITVLELPPVDSAQTAVKAAITRGQEKLKAGTLPQIPAAMDHGPSYPTRPKSVR